MTKYLPHELAEVVSDSLNNYVFDDQEFCAEMMRQHRTLQQSFTKLALLWLYSIGGQELFDLRNEASVEAGKKVMEALGPCGWALPLV